jgi:hypothetical protein
VTKQQQISGKEAMEAIRRILLSDWDPIGVMDDPEWPRDEYDGYIGELDAFIQRGETAEFVAKHLCFIEDKLMGLGAAPVSARIRVAEKLVNLRVKSADGDPFS